jgi:uncharacterized membrane protein
VFPAARRISVIAAILAPLPFVCVITGFLSLIWTADGPYAWHCLLGGLAGMYVFIGLEWLWLRRVRIVRIGTSSIEVRFGSRRYAEEFCRLNDFHCHERQGSKRRTPLVLNDVR